MFLPVLLVRDYGIWGFVVFAVPNIIGAAAMGWVLRQGASERLVRDHSWACDAFSVVTIAFQLFFALWFLPEMEIVDEFPHGGWGLILGLALLPICLILGRKLFAPQHARKVAVVVWVVSIGLFAGLFALGAFTLWQTPAVRTHAFIDNPDVLFLSPVCVFGFALCPYLDLTFHLARHSNRPSQSRSVFTIGFGVMFLAMILITLFATPLYWSTLGTPLRIASSSIEHDPTRLEFLLFIHLLLQLTLTICVHLERLSRSADSRRPTRVALFTLCCVSIAAGALLNRSTHETWLTVGETIYRLFMSFYGLVFPAYVWLCMIPTRDGHSGITGPRGRLKLITLALATLLAAPCYWLGFIERQEIWLVPGLAVVLLARLVVRGDRTDGAQAPASSASS